MQGRILDLALFKPDEWLCEVESRYPHPHYMWVRGVSAQEARALLARELGQGIAGRGSFLLGYESSQGRLEGLLKAGRLAWDTKHFGVETWKVEHAAVWGRAGEEEAEALLKEAGVRLQASGCRFLQARIPLDGLEVLHAMEACGFRTMEVLSTWAFEIGIYDLPPLKNPTLVRDFRPSDTGALVTLASRAYRRIPDRFHRDPHLNIEACDALYARWVANACQGQMADFIAVAEAEGRAVGYATLKDLGENAPRRLGQLGLGAVEPAWENRGIVSDLVIHCVEWFASRGGEVAFIRTQGNNIPAQRLFLKAGFRPVLTEVTLHRWYAS